MKAGLVWLEWGKDNRNSKCSMSCFGVLRCADGNHFTCDLDPQRWPFVIYHSKLLKHIPTTTTSASNHHSGLQSRALVHSTHVANVRSTTKVSCHTVSFHSSFLLVCSHSLCLLLLLVPLKLPDPNTKSSTREPFTLSSTSHQKMSRVNFPNWHVWHCKTTSPAPASQQLPWGMECHFSTSPSTIHSWMDNLLRPAPRETLPIFTPHLKVPRGGLHSFGWHAFAWSFIRLS